MALSGVLKPNFLTRLLSKVLFTSSLLFIILPSLADEILSPVAHLERIIDAGNKQNFTAVFNYNREGYSLERYVYQQVSDDGRKEWIRESSDEKQGFLRINGLLKCVTKGFKNKFKANTIFQSLHKEDIPNLIQDYTITLASDELIVDGRPAQELVFTAKDEYRYNFKIAFDKETSFPLRFLFLNNQNQILESGQFNQFKPVAKSEEVIAEPFKNCRIVKHKTETDKQSIWVAGWLPSGFSLFKVIHGNDNNQNDHLVYSDGLVFFSVFIEPLNDPRMNEMQKQFGATAVISRKLTLPNSTKQFMVTVVGEIPLSAAERIAFSITNDQL